MASREPFVNNNDPKSKILKSTRRLVVLPSGNKCRVPTILSGGHDARWRIDVDTTEEVGGYVGIPEAPYCRAVGESAGDPKGNACALGYHACKFRLYL